MIAPRRTRLKRYSGTMRPMIIGVFVIFLGLFLVLRTRYSEKPGMTGTAAGQVKLVENTVAPRKIYPLSVIHGGAYSSKELERARKTDAVVAEHYADFGAKPKFQKLSQDLLMYVSYRRSNQVYWSKTRHRIPQGETVISDGTCMARARCGNRLSATAKLPVAAKEPTEDVLNTPLIPDEPVSYKLAELPGPAGRPFNFFLPAGFDELGPAVPGAMPARVAGGPVASGALPAYFPAGPGGYGGGGSGPFISSGKQPSTTAGSTVPSGTAAPVTSSLPIGTSGGSTLPTSPTYPGSGTNAGPVPTGAPTETVVEVAPEPGAFGYVLLGIGLALIQLVRRSHNRLLRG